MPCWKRAVQQASDSNYREIQVQFSTTRLTPFYRRSFRFDSLHNEQGEKVSTTVIRDFTQQAKQSQTVDKNSHKTQNSLTSKTLVNKSNLILFNESTQSNNNCN